MSGAGCEAWSVTENVSIVLQEDSPREQAREMRLMGKGYGEIARELCVTPERVYAWCEDSFALPGKHRALVTERGISVARLERVLRTALELAADTGEDPRVRVAAIAQVVSIEARRARLLGLDSPERLEALVAQLDDESKTVPMTPQRAKEIMMRNFGLVGPKVEKP